MAPARVLRLCLDVNVLVADFLSRRNGAAGGASSKILDLVRVGACALGPVQLVLSWRMLTTLGLVLERFGVLSDEAWAVCRLFATVAEFGPLQEAPAVILGGTGLLPLRDQEDAGVAEAALAGRADLLITHDLDDFERGPRSNLATSRLVAKANGRPAVLIVDGLGQSLAAVTPEVAVGWLQGQAVAPAEVSSLLARPPFRT